MKRPKLTAKEKLLFLFPLLFLLWPITTAIRQEFRRDALERSLRKLAGPNAVDCGVSQFGSNGPVAHCAMASYKANKAFLARFTYGPKDSGGMAMTPQGQTYSLMYKHGSWFSQGEIHRMALIKRLTADNHGIRHALGVGVSSTEQTRLLTGE